MNKISIYLTLFFLFLTACQDQKNSSPDSLNSSNIFILCEGNYNQSNASLWSLDPQIGVQGPIYQNMTGNPLGDIAQSMAYRDNRLWVINNNTHSIEIFLLDQEIMHENSIPVPGASPRYMTFLDDRAYVTCWYIPGIIVIDANAQTVIDTIFLSGLPEMIVEKDGYLYTGIIMDHNWKNTPDLLKLTPQGQIVKTYNVINGPDQLLLKNEDLYVTSVYYDSVFNSNTGTSKINLMTDEVIKKDHGAAGSGQDLLILNNQVYRIFEGGVMPFMSDLTLNKNQKIGNETGLYSAAAYGDNLFFGLTDFQAPDEIKMLDGQGLLIGTYQVGAIPGSFLFFDSE